MIKLIGAVVVIMLMICFVGWVSQNYKRQSKTKRYNFSSFSENELVKQFNKLCDIVVGKHNDKDIDTIADKMITILKEYKYRKIEQFVESEQMLERNKKHLNIQIAHLETQISKLESDAKALAHDGMSDAEYEIGAMYVAQIEDSRKLMNELIKTRTENDEHLDKVEKQVKTFNTKFALKEASITNMIVKAKTHCNFSNVDLKLNDIITEFNDRVSDIEVEQRVRKQIQNSTEEENKSVDFMENKAEYIDKFKKMVNR